MIFSVRNTLWKVQFLHPLDDKLLRSDGSRSCATTDNNLKTIFLASNLNGWFLNKVLRHEIVHVFCFEYGIHLSLEFEEFLADFIATYGENILDTANMIFSQITRSIA